MIAGGHKLNETTEKIIGCAFRVSNVLGVGSLEKVYENALVLEVRKAGLDIVQQAEMEVTYDGERLRESVRP